MVKSEAHSVLGLDCAVGSQQSTSSQEDFVGMSEGSVRDLGERTI